MNYSIALKDARLQKIVDFLDSSPGPGVLRIGTASMAKVLANVNLAKPSGTVTNGVLTFSGLPKNTAAVAIGAAAAAQLLDGAGDVVVDGLVVSSTPGEGHLILDTTTVSAVGQIINITSAQIVHA